MKKLSKKRWDQIGKIQIQKHTENWIAEDTIAFLDYLSNRIGIIPTLNRIKGASYFLSMRNYSLFINLVSFYENYIGKDGVTYRLNRSLSGFHKGDTIEIKRVIEFLEKYLGNRDILQKMMMKNLHIFSPLSSKPNVQTNLENLKDVIAYLQSIGIKKEQVQSMIIDNLGGFIQATRNKLEVKRQSLIKVETIGIAFTYDEINKMIEQNIQDFLQTKLKKIKQMVTYLQSINFKDEKIKDMAIRNLKSFSRDDP